MGIDELVGEISTGVSMILDDISIITKNGHSLKSFRNIALATLIAGGSSCPPCTSAQVNPVAQAAKNYYSDQISSNVFNVSVTGSNPNYVPNGALTLENISQTEKDMTIAVKNTSTNSEVWLIESDTLNFDPRVKHWNPVYSFTPDSAKTFLTIPTTNQGTHFFRAMNIDNYGGASVSIKYPKKSAGVSGEEIFEVSVGADIFDLKSVGMYADGEFLDQLNTNSGRFYYDSRMKLNGPRILQANAVNSLDLNVLDSPEMSKSSSQVNPISWSLPIQVYSQNEVFLMNNPEYARVDANLPIRLLSLSPINVDVEVNELDATNGVTTSAISDSEIYYPYHYTFVNANLPLNSESLIYDLNVNYSLRTNAVNSGLNTSSNITFTTMVDRKGVRRKESFYTWGEWKDSYYNDLIASDINFLSYRHWISATTVPAWPSLRTTTRVLADSPYSLEISRSREAADLAICYSIFSDPRNSEFTFNGHGGQIIGVGNRGDSLNIGISATLVAQRLGNTSTNRVKLMGRDLLTKRHIFYDTRYIISDVSGCMTVEQPSTAFQWNEVFGAPGNINQDQRLDMEPNASFEYEDTAYVGFTHMNFQKYWNSNFRAVEEPTHFPIRTVIQDAIYQFNVMESSPTLSGSRKVVWLTGQRSEYPN